MNLVLFEAGDIDRQGIATITGPRARDLVERLDTKPGDRLRAGVIDGAAGAAEVLVAMPERIEIRCLFPLPPTPSTRADAPRDTLVLGLPRPKVLARVLESATCLGFGQIVVVRSWRSDKSHLESRLLRDPELRRRQLIKGLEQSCRTRLPQVEVHGRFRPFVEDQLAARSAAAARYVAIPSSDEGPPPTDSSATEDEPRPFFVAIGPERGFTPFENDLLIAQGFAALGLGAGVLTVETAVAVAHTRLADARQRAAALHRST